MTLSEKTDQRVSPGTRTRALVGPILVGIGIIHLACTPLFQPAFADLLATRLVGRPASSVLAEQMAQERGFWYVIGGAAVLMLGGLAWWAERRIGPLPAALGVALLLLTASGLLLGPLTGFWLFLVPGVLVLLRRRRTA